MIRIFSFLIMGFLVSSCGIIENSLKEEYQPNPNSENTLKDLIIKLDSAFIESSYIFLESRAFIDSIKADSLSTRKIIKESYEKEYKSNWETKLASIAKRYQPFYDELWHSMDIKSERDSVLRRIRRGEFDENPEFLKGAEINLRENNFGKKRKNVGLEQGYREYIRIITENQLSQKSEAFIYGRWFGRRGGKHIIIGYLPPFEKKYKW